MWDDTRERDFEAGRPKEQNVAIDMNKVKILTPREASELEASVYAPKIRKYADELNEKLGRGTRFFTGVELGDSEEVRKRVIAHCEAAGWHVKAQVERNETTYQFLPILPMPGIPQNIKPTTEPR